MLVQILRIYSLTVGTTLKCHVLLVLSGLPLRGGRGGIWKPMKHHPLVLCWNPCRLEFPCSLLGSISTGGVGSIFLSLQKLPSMALPALGLFPREGRTYVQCALFFHFKTFHMVGSMTFSFDLKAILEWRHFIS